MEVNSIEQSIRTIIASVSNVPKDADANADLYLDLGMPSAHALALLQELEDSFGVSIPDEQFVESTTIAKLKITLDGLLNSRV
jgi:acyl carrier protein